MKLAIIIPALNEADSIGIVLRNIPRGLAEQVIVVDNGSTDGTAGIARDAGATVISEVRRGYGRACLAGLAHLREDIDVVAILDADGSDEPRTLQRLLEPIEEDVADFVLSARTLGDAANHLTPQQRFGNWLACFLMRLGWGHRYRDCGPLRVIRRDSLVRLRMADTTWGWNVEMQIKAVKQELRILEIPVLYGCRIAGKSKISGTVIGTIRAGVKIISTIGRLWYCSRFGKCAPVAAPKPRDEALVDAP